MSEVRRNYRACGRPADIRDAAVDLEILRSGMFLEITVDVIGVVLCGAGGVM